MIAIMSITLWCIGLGAALLLWAYITSKLEHRFPNYFRWSQKAFDNLPKIAAIIVIFLAVYYFFTQPSYYD